MKIRIFLMVLKRFNLLEYFINESLLVLLVCLFPLIDSLTSFLHLWRFLFTLSAILGNVDDTELLVVHYFHVNVGSWAQQMQNVMLINDMASCIPFDLACDKIICLMLLDSFCVYQLAFFLFLLWKFESACITF